MDADLTYGKDSNVLLESIIQSNLTITEWNGTVYESQTRHTRFTHEIKYPDALVNDFPLIEPKIHGYSIWILSCGMVLAIAVLSTKYVRKKK